jgi:hypothetical protein
MIFVQSTGLERLSQYWSVGMEQIVPVFKLLVAQLQCWQFLQTFLHSAPAVAPSAIFSVNALFALAAARSHIQLENAKALEFTCSLVDKVDHASNYLQLGEYVRKG